MFAVGLLIRAIVRASQENRSGGTNPIRRHPNIGVQDVGELGVGGRLISAHAVASTRPSLRSDVTSERKAVSVRTDSLAERAEFELSGDFIRRFS